MAKSKNLKNKKMSNEVYALKKEAMKYIYEAKALDPSLPRITVRITEDEGRTLGQAAYGKNIIWIVERAVNNKSFDLRTIVFHEILHTVYLIRHDEDCPLMKAIHTPLTKRECEKYFKKWIKRSDRKTQTMAA